MEEIEIIPRLISLWLVGIPISILVMEILYKSSYTSFARTGFEAALLSCLWPLYLLWLLKDLVAKWVARWIDSIAYRIK